jgi:hypothetical protein
MTFFDDILVDEVKYPKEEKTNSIFTNRLKDR